MFERFLSWLTEDRLSEDGGAGGGAGGVGGIANAAGTGAVAGLGVGPKGEPGVDNRKKKKTRLEKLNARIHEHHVLVCEGRSSTKELIITCNDPDDSLEELIKFIGRNGSGGHSFSIVVDPNETVNSGKKFYFDGDGSDSIQDVLARVMEAVDLDVTKADVEKAAKAVHDQWMDKQKELGHTEHKSPDGKEDYMVPYEDLSKPAKDLDRVAVHAVLDALKTEAYAPSDEKFAGATVFEVDMDRVMKGQKHPRHRYSRYVGTDEIGETIRQHGRKNKGDIVLKDSATAVMTYLRRKQVKG